MNERERKHALACPTDRNEPCNCGYQNRVDAERYRWLRSESGCDLLHVNCPIGDEFDAWVDKCMAEQAARSGTPR